MNAPEKPFLADIQAHPDHRSMAVDRVDVRSIRHPIGIERAYDPPKFVEDRKRDVPIALEREPRTVAFVVESENFESIHNHSARALIRRSGRV